MMENPASPRLQYVSHDPGSEVSWEHRVSGGRKDSTEGGGEWRGVDGAIVSSGTPTQGYSTCSHIIRCSTQDGDRSFRQLHAFCHQSTMLRSWMELWWVDFETGGSLDCGRLWWCPVVPSGGGGARGPDQPPTNLRAKGFRKSVDRA